MVVIESGYTVQTPWFLSVGENNGNVLYATSLYEHAFYSGAKTIEPDTWEAAVGIYATEQSHLFLRKYPLHKWLSQLAMGGTNDVGTQLYLGEKHDIRYQFAQWMIGTLLSHQPSLDLCRYMETCPCKHPYVHKLLWMTHGNSPGVTLTTKYLIRLDPLQETLVSSAVGTTIRLERQGSRVRWGYTLDGQYTIGRGAPIGFSGGIDMSWVRQSKQLSD